jgi:hypothetical protein
VLTYTSCAGCDKIHTVTGPGDDTHQGCDSPWPRNLRRLLTEAILAGDTDRADHYARELDALNEAPPRLLDAALIYASWGWPVFPCVPGQKKPIVKHGLHAATVDPQQIARWWRKWPHANIALATGYAFDVIDIDPQGMLWWAERRERYGGRPGGPFPDIHGEVATPRPGGTHAYVQPSGEGNLADFRPGVDYRGAGGYVLAPPSVLDPTAYTDQGKTAPDVRHLSYTWWVYPSPVIKPALDTHDCAADSCGGWRGDPPCGGCCTCLRYCQHDGLPDDIDGER